MLEVKNLACLREDGLLFSGLDLRIAPGEILLIAGPNGAGKTSLLRILAGLARPEQGAVFWRRRDIRRQRPDYHRDLLYIGHQTGIKRALTPLENLAFYQTAVGQKRDDDAIFHALQQAGLAGYEDVPAGGLSAGQQRRVALARLWLGKFRLWILDEPFTAIDSAGVSRLMARFAEHSAARGIILLTTHQAMPPCPVRIRELTLPPAEETACSG
ncbi:cytochrome c biogenesis heme-transporting ATPase CcmA [Martelella alba]|uniref:Cytochrome c biogenesis heme-transporting ATPase CcmA n=1 Tax=Martelella alba TaxID=2590451 RepID=A0ABY2SH35_9HYPH|nr:cytochrome c biogenesis heme-transporting ATPase CcmA [Martelella alba]TKI03868.1 cytochrome c biogenesis heme-transporting ATPase CcmA [Martelella alba]